MAVDIDYVGAVVRNWIVIAAVFLTALLASVIISASRTRVYESSAQLVVAPAPGAMDPTDIIRSVETLDRRTIVATFARIPSAAPLQNGIATQLGLPPEKAAAFDIRGSVVPNTNVIRIDVQGPDAALTAAIANAAATATAREATALYPVYALRILSPATAPAKPSYPDTSRNLTIGAALGIFLGIASALAVDRLRPATAAGSEPA